MQYFIFGLLSFGSPILSVCALSCLSGKGGAPNPIAVCNAYQTSLHGGQSCLTRSVALAGCVVLRKRAERPCQVARNSLGNRSILLAGIVFFYPTRAPKTPPSKIQVAPRLPNCTDSRRAGTTPAGKSVSALTSPTPPSQAGGAPNQLSSSQPARRLDPPAGLASPPSPRRGVH